MCFLHDPINLLLEVVQIFMKTGLLGSLLLLGVVQEVFYLLDQATAVLLLDFAYAGLQILDIDATLTLIIPQVVVTGRPTNSNRQHGHPQAEVVVLEVVVGV